MKTKLSLSISCCIPVNPEGQSNFALLKIIIKLPIQVIPSPINPSLHSQVYELIPSIHSALVSQG